MTTPSRKVALAGAAVLAAAAAAATAAATSAVTADDSGGTHKPAGTVLALPDENPNKWTAPPPDA